MAENSGIEWTTHSFNPWRGCQKVSPACKNCYADTRANLFGEDFSKDRIVLSEAGWKDPVKWNRYAIHPHEKELLKRSDESGWLKCVECGHDDVKHKASWDIGSEITHFCRKCHHDQKPVRAARPRVFCASLGDVFEDWSGPMTNSKGRILNAGPNGDGTWNKDDWWICDHTDSPRITMVDVRRRLFALIDATPNLDWLLLTKRPENIRNMWPYRQSPAGNGHLPCTVRHNVWIGATADNQEQADKRIPELLKCRDLSPVLFLSCEPLLGPVDLNCVDDGSTIYEPLTGEWEFLNGKEVGRGKNIDWVIAGGESGPNARPSHPDWFRSLRDQCEVADVPFFFKQWGEWGTGEDLLGKDRGNTKSCFVCPSGHNGEMTQSGLRKHATNCNQAPMHMYRVGKKKAGRLLDGQLHNEFPKESTK